MNSRIAILYNEGRWIEIAVTYVDQFILDNLKSLTKGLLSDSKLMRQEVLAGLPDRLVDDFINTYCNDKPNQGKPIQVATTFPAQAPTNPFILVQFKQGVEAQDDSSIGNVQGSVYDAQQGNTVVKKLPVHTDKQKAFIELPEPAYGVYHVKEVTDYSFKNNRVYVPYFPFYDDQQHLMTVTYYQKTKDRKSVV